MDSVDAVEQLYNQFKASILDNDGSDLMQCLVYARPCNNKE
jgi:hypothetical protein